jgi:uncharacterized protein YggE
MQSAFKIFLMFKKTISSVSILGLLVSPAIATASTNEKPYGNMTGMEQMHKNTVSISGYGRGYAQTDGIVVSFSMEIKEPTLKKGNEKYKNLVEQIVKQLESYGVTRKDIRTSYWNSYPEYNYDEAGNATTVKLQNISRTVEVRVNQAITEDDVLGKLENIDGLIANNFNTVKVLKNQETRQKALKEARSQAFADAKARAEELATLAGMKVGKLVKIEDFSYNLGDPSSYQIGEDPFYEVNLTVIFELK